MMCQCSLESEAIRRPGKGPLKMASGGRGSLDGRGSLLVSPQDCHRLDLFLFPAVCQGLANLSGLAQHTPDLAVLSLNPSCDTEPHFCRNLWQCLKLSCALTPQ